MLANTLQDFASKGKHSSESYSKFLDQQSLILINFGIIYHISNMLDKGYLEWSTAKCSTQVLVLSQTKNKVNQHSSRQIYACLLTALPYYMDNKELLTFPLELYSPKAHTEISCWLLRMLDIIQAWPQRGEGSVGNLLLSTFFQVTGNLVCPMYDGLEGTDL